MAPRPESTEARPAPRRRPAATGRPDAAMVVARLSRTFPGADTELHYRNAFELLVATVLSAQSTDARVNTVTPALFTRYPDAATMSRATPGELEPQLVPTGFFRQKARALLGLSRALLERHGGEVPASMEALVALPGVGRKTANVVLGHALGVPGLPVDRHVLRVANRIGIATAATPEKVETQLCEALPPEDWTLASDCLILHGRRVCRPRPLCQRCVVKDVCVFVRSGGPAARPATPPRRVAKAASPGAARSRATVEHTRRAATRKTQKRKRS